MQKLSSVRKFHIALAASSRSDAQYVNDECPPMAPVLPVAKIGDFGTSVDAT
jgi:hypothetical protein